MQNDVAYVAEQCQNGSLGLDLEDVVGLGRFQVQVRDDLHSHDEARRGVTKACALVERNESDNGRAVCCLSARSTRGCLIPQVAPLLPGGKQRRINRRVAATPQAPSLLLVLGGFTCAAAARQNFAAPARKLSLKPLKRK